MVSVKYQRVVKFLFYLVPLSVSFCFQVDEDFYQTFYTRVAGYRLNGHVMRAIDVSDVLDCGMECSGTFGCRSFNFKITTKPRRCELNNKTMGDAPNDLKKNGNYSFHNACPCGNGGTCQQGASPINIVCKCTKEYDGAHCQTYVPLGTLPKNPAKSCQHIKNSVAVADATNGPYWIDPGNSGTPFLVYCDLTTDGGGWVLVTNIVMPSPVQKPALALTSSFREISNYNNNHTLISATNLRELQQVMPFTQLRYQCYERNLGRMVDIITSKDSNGTAVVNYYTAQTDTLPMACNSFYRGPGDNSTLAQTCERWGNEDGRQYIGKWGHFMRKNEWRLHDHAFFVANSHHWIIHSVNFVCDGLNSVPLSADDFWKIYVR